MTQAEQKREELRLISLRVDELKAQNKAYADQTDSLKEEFERNEGLTKVLVEQVQALKSEIEELTSKKDSLLQEIMAYEKSKMAISDEYSSAVTGMETASKKKESLQREIEDQKTLLRKFEEDVNEKNLMAKSQFDSLKGFEEQLLIREALLNRREETLDRREQGIKI